MRSKNRERLLNEEIAETFFQRVLERARPYTSDEHFTVDGTLDRGLGEPEGAFRRKDGEGQPAGSGRECRFSRREAEEPDPRDRRPIPMPGYSPKSKGSEAKLSYLGRCGDGKPQRTFGADVSDRGQRKSGTRCRVADSRIHPPKVKRVTLGGDKNYDTQEFVKELRGMNITPHAGAEPYQSHQCGGSADHAACGISIASQRKHANEWSNRSGG